MLDLWQSIRYPSRELTYPTLGQAKSSTQKWQLVGDMWSFPGGSLDEEWPTFFLSGYIWLWFVFPASGTSVSTPMDRKTSEMSCETRGPRGPNGNSTKEVSKNGFSKKNRGSIDASCCFEKTWSFPNPHTSWCPYMNLKKKTWKIRSPIATHKLAWCSAELGSPISNKRT